MSFTPVWTVPLSYPLFTSPVKSLEDEGANICAVQEMMGESLGQEHVASSPRILGRGEESRGHCPPLQTAPCFSPGDPALPTPSLRGGSWSGHLAGPTSAGRRGVVGKLFISPSLNESLAGKSSLGFSRGNRAPSGDAFPRTACGPAERCRRQECFRLHVTRERRLRFKQ